MTLILSRHGRGRGCKGDTIGVKIFGNNLERQRERERETYIKRTHSPLVYTSQESGVRVRDFSVGLGRSNIASTRTSLIEIFKDYVGSLGDSRVDRRT